MFEMTQPNTITASSINQSNSPTEMAGLDLLSSIQVLLVKDYDSQLRSLAKQIKGTTKIKESYRGVIEKIQKDLISLKTEKIKDKDYVVYEDSTQADYLNYQLDFKYDHLSTNIKDEDRLSFTRTENPIKGTIDVKKNVQDRIYNPKTNKYTTTTRQIITERKIPKSSLEDQVEVYKQKLESLNEQSELNSLGLQSLTNQRKVAFETISNLVSKHHDGVSTIVRNMKS